MNLTRIIINSIFAAKKSGMLRGITKFKCDDCGHIFKAFDIELAATVYTMPATCPKCGSRHTMPVSFFGCTDRKTYKEIWEMMDNK